MGWDVFQTPEKAHAYFLEGMPQGSLLLCFEIGGESVSVEELRFEAAGLAASVRMH